MNPKPVFTGIAAALVTFFDEHGHVDNAATAKHATHLASRGVRAVVVAGSTGEASHLSMKERLQLLKAVKAAVPAHVPVLLGTGDLTAGVSVPDLTRRAAEAGADAALVLSPRHGDVREFYGEVVGAAGGMPVFAYHWPKVSPPGITMEELKALKVAGHQGLDGRHGADARDAGLLPPADLRGQRLGRGLRRDARADRRHPRRREHRAGAVRRRLRRRRSRPRRTCSSPTASSATTA